jgi:hypothetical protein
MISSIAAPERATRSQAIGRHQLGERVSVHRAVRLWKERTKFGGSRLVKAGHAADSSRCGCSLEWKDDAKSTSAGRGLGTNRHNLNLPIAT